MTAEADSVAGGPFVSVPGTGRLDGPGAGCAGGFAQAISFVEPGVLAAAVVFVDSEQEGTSYDASVCERRGHGGFSQITDSAEVSSFASDAIASNGRGRAIASLPTSGGVLQSGASFNGSLLFQANTGATSWTTQTPMRSRETGTPAVALSPEGGGVVAWQEHDDEAVGAAAPISRVMLSFVSGEGLSSPTVVLHTAQTALPAETGVALLGNSTAFLAWTGLDAAGRTPLRVATVALRASSAQRVRTLSPAQTSATAVSVQGDGHGAAIVTWIAHSRRGGAQVMALLARGPAPAQGRVIALSPPRERVSKPLVTGDGSGHLVVAWIQDGKVRIAAGTVADGLRTRRVIGADATGLSLNFTPAPISVLSWESNGRIQAAEVGL